MLVSVNKDTVIDDANRMIAIIEKKRQDDPDREFARYLHGKQYDKCRRILEACLYTADTKVTLTENDVAALGFNNYE